MSTWVRIDHWQQWSKIIKWWWHWTRSKITGQAMPKHKFNCRERQILCIRLKYRTRYCTSESEHSFTIDWDSAAVLQICNNTLLFIPLFLHPLLSSSLRLAPSGSSLYFSPLFPPPLLSSSILFPPLWLANKTIDQGRTNLEWRVLRWFSPQNGFIWGENERLRK